MMKWLWCAFLLFLLAMSFGSAGAETKAIEVREQLNRRWAGQVVTEPFSAGNGRCHVNSLSLKGPDGEPVPVQFLDLRLWQGTQWVRSARVAFPVPELKPLSTLTWTLSYGRAPTSVAAASDLKVIAKEDAVQMTTSHFGIRVLNGEQAYETPKAPAEVPGPIRALMLRGGKWFGASRLTGDTRVKSWRCRLVMDGPVLAESETQYTYEDGNTLTVRCRLAAGDYAAQIEMLVTKDDAGSAWELLLTDGVKIERAVCYPGRNGDKKVAVAFKPGQEEPPCTLNPWGGDGWFRTYPSAISLPTGEGELQLSVRDAGEWVKPQPLSTYGQFRKWTYAFIGELWSGWQSKMIPLLPTEDGGVRMRMSLLSGSRRWTIGHAADSTRLVETLTQRAMTAWTPRARLDEARRMMLSWPDRGRHPRLFVGPREMHEAERTRAAWHEDVTDVEKLRAALDSLGGYDLMRYTMRLAARYDAVMGAGKLSAEDKALFKAQMAWTAHQVRDPWHWSIERGFCSGNPNMTVARVLNVGIMGCVLRDHPLSQEWGTYAVDSLKYWLAEVTGPRGQWVESSHYARVSWSEMIPFAICARRAKFYDFFKEPKFKAMGTWYEQTLTPRDPMRRTGSRAAPMAVRVGAPYGRGTRGGVWGLGGLMAACTAGSDPEYSRIMQWSWRRSGFSQHFGHSTAGMLSLIVDRELSYAQPDWRSERFGELGHLLRSHVGTPWENYLLLVSEYYTIADGQIWPPDTGAIAKWFAGGTPIGGSFRRVPEVTYPLTVNRVLPACNWDGKKAQGPGAGYVTEPRQDGFTRLPQLDYVNMRFHVPEIVHHHLNVPRDLPPMPPRRKVGEAPLDWQRQVMLVGDETPEGPNYLVLRDTVSSDQPTQWHFWTLSEKIGTPEQAADREAFLKDKPGAKNVPARALQGDRFTALGQFDRDLEYFVAAPTNTPRYTARYGTRGSAYGTRGFNEFQDLMHLQLEGPGVYFVALFPRRHDEKAPAFETFGEGKVIGISGDFGRDLVFLSRQKTSAVAAEAAFTGTAAGVQDRPTGLKLVLGAAGSVRYRTHGIVCDGPVLMQVTPTALDLRFEEGFAGGTVTITAPGQWTVRQEGVKAEPTQDGVKLQVPKGTQRVTLRAK